jgi:hypothetical protein
MNKEDLKNRISSEEDVINYPKYNNSLKNFKYKYPNGVDFKMIAKVLMIDESEAAQRYDTFIKKVQKELGYGEENS